MGNTACGDLCNGPPESFRNQHNEDDSLPPAESAEAVKMNLNQREKSEPAEDLDILRVNEDFKKHEEMSKEALDAEAEHFGDKTN